MSKKQLNLVRDIRRRGKNKVSHLNFVILHYNAANCDYSKSLWILDIIMLLLYSIHFYTINSITVHSICWISMSFVLIHKFTSYTIRKSPRMEIDFTVLIMVLITESDTFLFDFTGGSPELSSEEDR